MTLAAFICFNLAKFVAGTIYVSGINLNTTSAGVQSPEHELNNHVDKTISRMEPQGFGTDTFKIFTS